MARRYGDWKQTLGNNITGNQDLHRQMMNDKNLRTMGGYQAEVSGMYGEFTIASVFKSLPEEYAVLNDILIQTGTKYRRYSQKDYVKYGETPWELCVLVKTGKSGKLRVYQKIDKRKGLNIIRNNPRVNLYEKVKQSSQLDHVIVSPYGIFVIETKNHKGMIFGDVNGKVWTETFLSSHHTFYNPVHQNAQHLKYLSQDTSINPNCMIGFIVFTNPQADLSNVRCPFCLTVDQLLMAVLSYNRIIWNEEQKDRIIKIIERNNSSNYSLSKEHVTFVKDLQHRYEVNRDLKRNK